jgi:hypothetical protein
VFGGAVTGAVGVGESTGNGAVGTTGLWQRHVVVVVVVPQLDVA